MIHDHANEGAYFTSDDLSAVVPKAFSKNTIDAVCKDSDSGHHADEIKKLIPQITFNVQGEAKKEAAKMELIRKVAFVIKS